MEIVVIEYLLVCADNEIIWYVCILKWFTSHDHTNTNWWEIIVEAPSVFSIKSNDLCHLQLEFVPEGGGSIIK